MKSALHVTIHHAACILDEVLRKVPLDHISMQQTIEPQGKSLVYQTLKHYRHLKDKLHSFVQKKTISHVQHILMIALLLIDTKRHQDFVVVQQAVDAAGMHHKAQYAKPFINAVLRRYIDQIKPTLSQQEAEKINFLPDWWQAKVDAQYMAHIMQHPPMMLRVNPRKISREAYLDVLREADVQAQAFDWYDSAQGDGKNLTPYAVWLTEPLPVEEIPYFAAGYVSVQDAAAQIVPQLLNLQDGMHILDACSAPGGKLMACLEQYKLHVQAVEISPMRYQRVEENIIRLNLQDAMLSYQAHIADAAHFTEYGAHTTIVQQSNTYIANHLFDVIIADVPCSASGVVRKHPDIAFLRQWDDIVQLGILQLQLLEQLWGFLKPGGCLIYSTCSVFYEEGEAIISNFLAKHSAHCVQKANGFWPGHIPVTAQHDGFFYAILQK